jgi:hypothetical protein
LCEILHAAGGDDKTRNKIKHRLVDKLIIVQVVVKFLAFNAISKVITRAQNKTLARTVRI